MLCTEPCHIHSERGCRCVMVAVVQSGNKFLMTFDILFHTF